MAHPVGINYRFKFKCLFTDIPVHANQDNKQLSILLPTFQRFVLLTKAFQSWHGFLKGLDSSSLKSFSMSTNLTLDDMILQYSENPFIDEKMFDLPSDIQQKQKILSRLLNIASNLFSKAPVRELNSYKRRYEIKYGV
jgi:hypothetical protein